uniref:Uncharacterized protein n=1 Tax=Mastacembelus armatus TaxID=205130 RepID=A0A3Q3SUD4_9TELE
MCNGFIVHSEGFPGLPQSSAGPLSLAMSDLNIWEANLSPSPERDEAGNQPLCRAEEDFFCFLSITFPHILAIYDFIVCFILSPLNSNYTVMFFTSQKLLY